MSHYDYKCSMKIAGEGYSFYALIMAAMRQADDKNLDMLRGCWPHIYKELFDRYNAPGGLLDHERQRDPSPQKEDRQDES